MTREDLKKIIEGISDEQLKTILDINSTDIGKAKKDHDTLKGEIETLKGEKKKLEDTITEMSNNADNNVNYKEQLEELQREIEEKAEKEKAAKEDAELTSAIEASFGDKKFTSEYVRNGIISDMKNLIAQKENKGKSYTEIFEALTKDKDGIFANPNPPATMAGMGKIDMDSMSEDTLRAVMGLAPNKE